jgi:hypothetical protein
VEVIGTFKIIVAIVLIWIAMIGLIVFGNSVAGSGQRIYNCSIAEISPDFTPKMREECRKLQREQQ